MDKSAEAERLRAIARSGGNGYYSGGVGALRAVWTAALHEAAIAIADSDYTPDELPGVEHALEVIEHEWSSSSKGDKS